MQAYMRMMSKGHKVGYNAYHEVDHAIRVHNSVIAQERSSNGL
jgi:hypothetical protein